MLTELPPEVLRMIFDLVADPDCLGTDKCAAPPTVREAVVSYGDDNAAYIAVQQLAFQRKRQAARDAGHFCLVCETINKAVRPSYMKHFFRRVALFINMRSLRTLFRISESASCAGAIEELYICNALLIAWGRSRKRRVRRLDWRDEEYGQFVGPYPERMLAIALSRLSATLKRVVLIESRLDLPLGTNLLGWLACHAAPKMTMPPTRARRAFHEDPEAIWLSVFRALLMVQLPSSRKDKAGTIPGLQLDVCYHKADSGISDIRSWWHHDAGSISSWKPVDAKALPFLTAVKTFNINIDATDYSHHTLAATIRHMTSLEKLAVMCCNRSQVGTAASSVERLVLACTAENLLTFSLTNISMRPGRLMRCLDKMPNLQVLKLEGVNLCNDPSPSKKTALAEDAWAACLQHVAGQAQRLRHLHLVLLRLEGRSVHIATADTRSGTMALDDCSESSMLRDELREAESLHGQYVCLPTFTDIKLKLPDLLAGHSIGAKLSPEWEDYDVSDEEPMKDEDEIYPIPDRRRLYA